jgi:hypothetical protein
LFGQLLATLGTATDAALLEKIVETEIDATVAEERIRPGRGHQRLLFEDA